MMRAEHDAGRAGAVLSLTDTGTGTNGIRVTHKRTQYEGADGAAAEWGACRRPGTDGSPQVTSARVPPQHGMKLRSP